MKQYYLYLHELLNQTRDKEQEKLKSLKFAGGETLIKPFISGLLISNCIATHAPKEKPATHTILELVLYCCNQSNTLAASLSSPSPSSNIPSLFPHL